MSVSLRRWCHAVFALFLTVGVSPAFAAEALPSSGLDVEAVVYEMSNGLLPSGGAALHSAEEVTYIADNLVSISINAWRPTEGLPGTGELIVLQRILANRNGEWSAVTDGRYTVRVASDHAMLEIGLDFTAREGADEPMNALDRLAGWSIRDTTTLEMESGWIDRLNRRAGGLDPSGLSPVLSSLVLSSSVGSVREVVVTDSQGVVVTTGIDGRWVDDVVAHLSGASAGGGGSQAASAGGGGGSGTIKGPPKKPGQSFWSCVYDCFSTLSTPIALWEMACIIGGIALCTAGGPAFPPCVIAVLTACGLSGLVAEVGMIIGCLFACM